MSQQFDVSLRDYFAAQALKGMLASNPSADHARPKAKWSRAEYAAMAYAMADALLAERERVTAPQEADK